MKILMVCLGNICRSPLAEGIMLDKIQKYHLNWLVDSAGTGAWHVDNPPDPRSIDVAKKNDIDISSQRARQFTAKDFQAFDLIFAMDSSNYQDILKLAQNNEDKEKVDLIMNMSDPNWNINVPDPYWGEHGFEKVYNMLNKATDAILERYAEGIKKPAT